VALGLLESLPTRLNRYPLSGSIASAGYNTLINRFSKRLESYTIYLKDSPNRLRNICGNSNHVLDTVTLNNAARRGPSV
jgi:hypothetical protein